MVYECKLYLAALDPTYFLKDTELILLPASNVLLAGGRVGAVYDVLQSYVIEIRNASQDSWNKKIRASFE